MLLALRLLNSRTQMDLNKIDNRIRRRRRRFGLIEIVLFFATFGIISSVAIPALAQYIERQETLEVLQSVPRPAECQVVNEAR